MILAPHGKQTPIPCSVSVLQKGHTTVLFSILLILLKDHALIDNALFNFFNLKRPRSQIFVLCSRYVDWFLGFIPTFHVEHTVFKLDNILLNVESYAVLLVYILPVDAITTPGQQRGQTQHTDCQKLSHDKTLNVLNWL